MQLKNMACSKYFFSVKNYIYGPELMFRGIVEKRI